eukprot:TRINITY_DN3574_c0_g1_i1.p1 TRINITY_DN3574_c0_g1~~TRINITY_DN3574_c0_g1_i1.p1  ORF type:complete len:197 (-),score=36.03 TRINITY_DN3574_c0_g1_i1:93-683(-)
MKVVVLLVLLAVVANSERVNGYFDLIKREFTSILETIEAKNQARGIEIATLINTRIALIKDRYPKFDARRLSAYGYEFTPCVDNIRRLESENWRVHKNIRLGHSSSVIERKQEIFDLINRTLQNCLRAEEVCIKITDANKDKPACQEALKKTQEGLKKLEKTEVDVKSYDIKRQALMFSWYAACGNPSQNKSNRNA